MSFLGSLWRFLSGGAGQEVESPASGDPQRIEEVQAVLSELRPIFLADGGDMRLVRVEDDGMVVVRLVGACHGCSVSTLTLQGALKPKLRERCPWFVGLRTLDG